MAAQEKEKYRFLHDHVAKQPHVTEILDEIMLYQQKYLSSGIGSLATLDDLKTSRNIKVPSSPTRNKIIVNHVLLLEKNYPDDIRSVVTFDFQVDPESKNLNIIETREYTVSMNNDAFNSLQAERDKVSASNLLELLARFRLFNLSKLVSRASAKGQLSRVIKSILGIDIFTFKHYKMDRNNLEVIEDYCFHKDNYEAVKKTLNVDNIRKIISNHLAQINHRLKKFGILNADFDDYSDTKVDYLLSILLDDIAGSLSGKELTEVKNFHSLRSCLTQVKDQVDPLLTMEKDIARYVAENGICRKSDIKAVYSIDDDTVDKWIGEHAPRYRIINVTDDDGVVYLLTNQYIQQKTLNLHSNVIENPNMFNQLSHSEKQKKLFEMDFIGKAARPLLHPGEKANEMFGSAEKADEIKTMIDDFEDFQHHLAVRSAPQTDAVERDGGSVLQSIVKFFRSLFSGRPEESERVETRSASSRAHHRKVSPETKNIFNQIKNSSGSINVLSNYIELNQANDAKIERIIDDLRGLNLKIVIPVYNARKVLYPNRSQHYLIPDVEYVLVDPEIIQTAESVREFTDSLAGQKLKDEKIPPSAIMNIEKYLLTLHRQKKAELRRKMRMAKKQ